MRNSTRSLTLCCMLFFVSNSFAQITYFGPPLTVPASASNNGNAVPNSFCNTNVGNCFDVDFPGISTDNNINDGILGPYDATDCTSLSARFTFSSSGNLDNGDDVFLCYRLNLATTYILAENNNAPNNPDADTDCGAQNDNNDLVMTNYNENATIGGVSNCDADWTNVDVEFDVYDGPLALAPTTSFQFRVCTDFDDPNESVTLDSYQIFGDNCAFNSFLPVELIRLYAKPAKDRIELSWASASEINFSHYEIEHSTDAKRFQTIHKTKSQAEGSSLRTLFYFWVHKEARIGDNYYRLKMVDKDGTFEYSQVVQATIHQASDVQLFPNPTTESFTLQNIYSTTPFQLTLMDLSGKTIKTWHNVTGERTFSIGELPKGIYQLLYHDEQAYNSLRLVKQ